MSFSAHSYSESFGSDSVESESLASQSVAEEIDQEPDTDIEEENGHDDLLIAVKNENKSLKIDESELHNDQSGKQKSQGKSDSKNIEAMSEKKTTVKTEIRPSQASFEPPSVSFPIPTLTRDLQNQDVHVKRLWEQENQRILNELERQNRDLQSLNLELRTKYERIHSDRSYTEQKLRKCESDVKNMQNELMESNQRAFMKHRDVERRHEEEVTMLNERLRQQQKDFIKDFDDIKSSAKRESRLLEEDLHRKKLELDARLKEIDVEKTRLSCENQQRALVRAQHPIERQQSSFEGSFLVLKLQTDFQLARDENVELRETVRKLNESLTESRSELRICENERVNFENQSAEWRKKSQDLEMKDASLRQRNVILETDKESNLASIQSLTARNKNLEQECNRQKKKLQVLEKQEILNALEQEKLEKQSVRDIKTSRLMEAQLKRDLRSVDQERAKLCNQKIAIRKMIDTLTKVLGVNPLQSSQDLSETATNMYSGSEFAC